MRSLLAGTAERIGPPPRASADGFFPPLSDTLQAEPALLRWASQRDAVWREGHLRWGCAVAPPRILGSHDPNDHAMLVVVADEEGASPELLHIVSMRIGDLLRQGVADPRLSDFESLLQIGVQGLVVPRELGGTVPCRVYTVVAHRAALPGRRLAHQLLPVVVTHGHQPSAMLVPARDWDPRWREAWDRGFQEPGELRRPHRGRLAFAESVSSRSWVVYTTLVGVLAHVPGAMVLLPILVGLCFFAISATLLLTGSAGVAVLGLLVGMLCCVPGVAAIALALRRVPPLHGLGLGGEPLADDEAPELWALVREAESRLDVMPVDHIVIDRSFQVTVHDRTAAVPFARQRLVMVVGLPLLLSVSPAHLRAMIYQALADGTPGWRGVRRRMSRHQGWIDGWRDASGAERTVRRWIRAYADVFHDLSLPLARRSVLYADKVAAGHAGAQTLADALVRSRVLDGWWQTRWDHASFEGGDASGPVPRPVARWRARGPELNPTMARLALTASLRRHDSGSYPPSPGERLKALGVRGRLVGDPPALACSLLGGSLLKLIDHVDDLFAVHFGETWRRSRHVAMRAHRRRDALAEVAPARRSLFQHLELIQLCKDLDEPQRAAQHGLEVARFFPRQAEAQLGAGLALVEVGDERGLNCLRNAVELDMGVAPRACAAAMKYLQGRDMHAEMEAWGELWSRARGSLSEQTVRETPAIVVQALAATSSG